MRLTFVGGGNMASALIGGLLAEGQEVGGLQVIEPVAATREQLAARFGVRTMASADDEALGADVILLAVKPQQMEAVATALAGRVQNALVISIAAGTRLADLSRWLGGHPRLVRAMPNTPALICAGVTGLYAPVAVSAAERALAERILGAAGDTVWVNEEALIDAVTAVSGSGPAYVFFFIEALERAAQSLGLSADQARRLALATFKGSSELAAGSNESPGELRVRVTSPGGTTAAALEHLTRTGVADQFVTAVTAARDRATELGEPPDR